MERKGSMRGNGDEEGEFDWGGGGGWRGKFDGGGVPNLIKSKSALCQQPIFAIYTSHSANTASTWPS